MKKAGHLNFILHHSYFALPPAAIRQLVSKAITTEGGSMAVLIAVLFGKLIRVARSQR